METLNFLPFSIILGIAEMNSKQISLKLPSEPASIQMLESFVERVVHKYKIQPDLYGDILVSLTEAVNNAIFHGNCADKEKLVQVKLRKQNGHLAFRVTDEGVGFDPASVPDPTQPENLCKCGGRGVFLMRELADNIAFHDNGSTVEMQFKLHNRK